MQTIKPQNIYLSYCLIFILTVFVCVQTLATTYYVSNNGSDLANGLTQSTPWQTIAHVNSQTLNPGDSILFEKGGVWRESILIQHSGNSDAYIVYSAYGTGAKPRIFGSNRAETWTAVTGETNIWEAATVLSAPRTRTGNSVTNHPSSIFFEETDGSITWGNMESLHLNSEGAPKDICEVVRDNGFALMDQEYDWCWEADHIYVYCTENPGNRYNCIEVPQRAACFYMSSHNPKEYIIIENLELLYALKYGFDGGWPMASEVHGLQIKNCHIGYMGTKGAASAIGLQVWHSDLLIQNNEIHDCGRRNISYNVYGDTRTSNLVFENVVFDNNTLYHGYHTTGIDINGGYTDIFQNFVISNNYIWDDPNDDPQNAPNDFSSMALFLNSGSAIFTGFKVYNNVFSFIKQKHIIANDLKNSMIVNNTFCGMNVRSLLSGYRQIILVSNNPENLVIDNNIFYNNIQNEYVLSSVTFSGSTTGTTMNNNLYYCVNASQRMVTINNTGESYRMDEWEDYRSDTGWDLDSPDPSDPLFRETANDLRVNYESPAIGAGIYYPDIFYDINGNLRDTEHPDIGAYEYQNTDDIPLSCPIRDTIFYSGDFGCFDATQSVLLAGDGSSVSFESGSTFDLISGNSITLLPGTTIQEGANVNAYITEDSSYCFVEIEGENVYIPGHLVNQFVWKKVVIEYENNDFKVFPNPTTGNFKVLIDDFKSVVNVSVVNLQGVLIFEQSKIESNLIEINLSHQQKGIYLVRLYNGKDILSRKIIVK